MPTAIQSTVLTIDDLAEYLKISKSTLYKLGPGGCIAMPEGWTALAISPGSGRSMAS